MVLGEVESSFGWVGRTADTGKKRTKPKKSNNDNNTRAGRRSILWEK